MYSPGSTLNRTVCERDCMRVGPFDVPHSHKLTTPLLAGKPAELRASTCTCFPSPFQRRAEHWIGIWAHTVRCLTYCSGGVRERRQLHSLACTDSRSGTGWLPCTGGWSMLGPPHRGSHPCVSKFWVSWDREYVVPCRQCCGAGVLPASCARGWWPSNTAHSHRAAGERPCLMLTHSPGPQHFHASKINASALIHVTAVRRAECPPFMTEDIIGRACSLYAAALVRSLWVMLHHS